jgi:hypothetical protein
MEAGMLKDICNVASREKIWEELNQYWLDRRKVTSVSR